MIKGGRAQLMIKGVIKVVSTDYLKRLSRWHM